MKNVVTLSLFLFALLGLPAVVISPAQALANPDGLISYRQNVLRAIGGHMGSIGQIMKHQLTFDEHIQGHAQSIADLVALLPKLFPKGTHKGKTDALPELWKDPKGFEKAAKVTVEKAQKLAEVAATGNMKEIGKALGDLGKNGCGGCHKKFRQPEKKRFAWKK